MMIANSALSDEFQSDHRPGEIEALLPWHAVGALTAQERRRVMRALAADPALVRIYADICHERAAIACVDVDLNDFDLNDFAGRARDKLFAAIAAEPCAGQQIGWGKRRRGEVQLSLVSTTEAPLRRLAVIA
jgi:hypothetical protein